MLAGCTQQFSNNAVESSAEAEQDIEHATVTLNPIYLKTGAEKEEILPLHVELSVQEATKPYVEEQLEEIKRILIVYFADKDLRDIKSSSQFLADKNLAVTINDFLKSGHIEGSRYKVSTEVL